MNTRPWKEADGPCTKGKASDCLDDFHRMFVWGEDIAVQRLPGHVRPQTTRTPDDNRSRVSWTYEWRCENGILQRPRTYRKVSSEKLVLQMDGTRHNGKVYENRSTRMVIMPRPRAMREQSASSWRRFNGCRMWGLPISTTISQITIVSRRSACLLDTVSFSSCSMSCRTYIRHD